MRKFLTFMLVGLLFIVITGCQNKTEPTSSVKCDRQRLERGRTGAIRVIDRRLFAFARIPCGLLKIPSIFAGQQG